MGHREGWGRMGHRWRGHGWGEPMGSGEGTGNAWDEPCRDMVLSAHWGPPAAHPQQQGGPNKQQGRTWGHRRWPGAGRRCLAPRGTHGKAGGTRRAGVAGLPWRSLCRRRRTLSPPSAPVSAPSPPLTPLTGSPLAPASPAGPRSPWRPFGGRREELQGVSCSPPGLCPPGSTAGQSAGDKDRAQVCDLHQPTAPACPAPPGTGGTRSSPGRAP